MARDSGNPDNFEDPQPVIFPQFTKAVSFRLLTPALHWQIL